MDNPTTIITLGLGALVALAGYIGFKQTTKEVPEIIDSDVHTFDNFNKDNKSQSVDEKSLYNEVDNKNENENENENNASKETKENKDAKINLEELKKETENEILETTNVVKEKGTGSVWGAFWKSEYDNISNQNPVTIEEE